MITDETGAPPLDFIVDLARRFPEKPIYVSCSGQKKHMEAAKAFLEPRGVPTFWFAEEALEALSFAAQCREAMERGGKGMRADPFEGALSEIRAKAHGEADESSQDTGVP
ncbi:MAG: hypothetical protein MZU91_00060 [Desulfosudis oleivorans]|nr:hypothetical protein [Desulfosudis oleivorans]